MGATLSPCKGKSFKLVIDYCLSSNDDAKIRQFPDTTKYQRVIRRDFQHAFNPKPVKQSNSPFCTPQLILFHKRKHRVKEKKTQHLIQYSVIQFFLKGLLFTPLKSKVYILSIYIYISIYNIMIKNTLQNNQSLSSGFSNPLSM